MENQNYQRIMISRTDNIGDVVLTLPMAALIKEKYPNAKVLFLGKKYTKPIIETCRYIDEFYDWDELRNGKLLHEVECDVIIHVFPNKKIAQAAKDANIKLRIGTSRRLYHWAYCNSKINLSRSQSSLHESQLNFKLLEPLGIRSDIEKTEIHKLMGFSKVQKLSDRHASLINKNKFNLILHPKTNGSGREWRPENYVELINSLPSEKFNIFISGTDAEKQFVSHEILSKTKNTVTDITGMLTLSEFISFIKECDGLVAASTGPLHIASALGVHALGLYPPRKPMSPNRWGPIGVKGQFLLAKNSRTNATYCDFPCKVSENCNCMDNLKPSLVKNVIEKWVDSLFHNRIQWTANNIEIPNYP